MSEGSNNGDSIEISVVLGSLSVTVRGPAQQASQLVSDITRQYSSGPRSSSPAPSESHYSLVDFPPRTVSAGPPCSTFSRRLESREEIERSFDLCPSNLVDSGRRLVGSTISGGQRVHRAWRAGQWAKAVLAGRAASPSRSEQIDLRPRFYVVLRGGKGSSSFLLFIEWQLLESSGEFQGQSRFLVTLLAIRDGGSSILRSRWLRFP